ncbi:MAG TPA: hypothetical protein VNV66_05185 [Pilimelia sp.]|nr:hypothetical protein [Pilimelia sp.]
MVGASTAAVSAASLYELAQACGIPGPLAAALPIALDAGAAVAALVWVTERGGLRRWGRGIALAALGATLAGNGAAHAITTGYLTVTLPLVLAVGACIPAMLFATVHLAALMTQPPTQVEKRPRRKLQSRSGAPTNTAAREPLRAVDAAPAPWAARARELIDGGVPKATAYRRAKREHADVVA